MTVSVPTVHAAATVSCRRISNDLGITSLPYEKKVTYIPWNKDFPLIRESNKCTQVHALASQNLR